MTPRYISIWGIFFVLTIIMRSVSFFLSVIDTDESLYLLMSNSLLEGNGLYKAIWDHKPPGIYLIFAFSKIIFQDSIFAIRIIACIAVASSASLLFVICSKIFRGRKTLSYLTGLLYVLFTLNNGGLASNTEIFFTPFVLGAFLLVFRTLPNRHLLNKNAENWTFSYKNLFMIGLLLGLAFQVKYVVIFDYMAVLCIMCLWALKPFKPTKAKYLIKYATSVSIAFIFPFILTVAYFYFTNDFDLYLDATFRPNVVISANAVFSVEVFSKSLIKFVEDNSLLVLGSLGALIYFLKEKQSEPHKLIVISLFIWLFFTFGGVMYTKKYYDHYYLQTLPPLCLLTSYILVKLSLEKYRTIERYTILGLIILPSFIHIIVPLMRLEFKIIKKRYFQDEKHYGDTSAKIADYINTILREEDYIYIANYYIIIYDFVKAKIPTQYVFPFFLLDDHFSDVAGVDQLEELNSILKKEPKIIVYNPVENDNAFYQKLRHHINSSYTKINSIDGIEIYELR